MEIMEIMHAIIHRGTRMVKDCEDQHGLYTMNLEIEVTSWLVSADDFSSRVARGANERVSLANK